MSGLDAGALIREFTLQTPSGTDPADFTDVATVWGSLAFRSGTENLQGGAPLGVGFFQIIIRHRDDVRAEMSLYESATSRRFQIQSYGDPTGEQEYLLVTALEVL